MSRRVDQMAHRRQLVDRRGDCTAVTEIEREMAQVGLVVESELPPGNGDYVECAGAIPVREKPCDGSASDEPACAHDEHTPARRHRLRRVGATGCRLRR